MATGPSGSPASTATMFVGDQGGLSYGRCPLRCPGSLCDSRALRTTYPAQCDARPRLVHARRGIERATRLPDPCGQGRREAPQEEAEKEEAKEAYLSGECHVLRERRCVSAQRRTLRLWHDHRRQGALCLGPGLLCGVYAMRLERAVHGTAIMCRYQRVLCTAATEQQ